LRETLDEILAAGGEAIAVQADASNGEDRERMMSEVVAQVGAPDILVNNAAVTFLRPLDEFPEKRARLMTEMHVLAPLSIYAVVLGVFFGSRGEAWPHAWKLAGIETIGEMPTLGRGRGRPRSATCAQPRACL